MIFDPLYFSICLFSGTAKWLWWGLLASQRIFSSDLWRRKFLTSPRTKEPFAFHFPVQCLYSMWYCWPKYFLSVWFVLTHVSIKKREVLHWIYYCTSAIHKIFSKYILYRKLPFLCFKFIWNSHWQYIWKWHGTNIFSIEVIGRGTKYILVLVQELLDHAVATLLKQIPQSY